MHFKNLKDLITTFSDENVCRQYMIERRWKGKPICPKCGCDKVYNIENGKRFKCANNQCYRKFSVTVGTVFENTNIPLTRWFPALYLISAHKKGISSLQLSRDLGVAQKTAWFMLHRIRESLREKESPVLDNTVEMDEIYMGGKNKNKHKKEREELSKNGTGAVNMTPVFGMLERKGNLKLTVLNHACGETMKPVIRQEVNKTAVIVTDGFGGYKDLHLEFAGHHILNHNNDEFVRGTFHTNSIEGFFSLLKRGIYGIYHQVSRKHLSRYCDEFAYRYNSRGVKDNHRFELTLSRLEGRLKYEDLISNE